MSFPLVKLESEGSSSEEGISVTGYFLEKKGFSVLPADLQENRINRHSIPFPLTKINLGNHF